MIYEILTIDLQPRTLPQVEAALESAFDEAGRPDELVGSFHTEFGDLNQVVQLRRYANYEDRARRTAARDVADTRCLDQIARHVTRIATEVAVPLPLSRELGPGHVGPFFEMRRYTFPPGTLPTIMASWEKAMPMRDALGSPVAAIWRCDVGVMNALIHIWPYQSLSEREAIRKRVRVGGLWPPYKLDEHEGRPGYSILTQANKLMLPAHFSPLQ